MTIRNRLEPDSRSVRDVPRAAKVQLSDPAWLLSRQWWTGELTGSNGGAPVQAQARLRVEHLTYGDGDSQAVVPSSYLAAPMPVKLPWRAALALGFRVIARLDAEIARLAALIAQGRDPSGNLKEMQFMLERNRTRLPEVFPLEADSPVLRRVPVARRVDGAAVLAAVRDQDPEAERLLTPETQRWLLGQDQGRGAFTPETATYSATITTHTDDVHIIDAPGPRLHWSDLRGSDHGDDVAEMTVRAVPVRLSYEGDAPASWWGLEAADRNWAAAPAGPSDLGQLLVSAAFAYPGQVALLVPLDVPTNTLASVREVTLIDGFGRETDAHAAHHGGAGAWHDGARGRWMPLLADAPILLGDATDLVSFGLDETDNLVWMEERVAPDSEGRGQAVTANRPDRAVTEPALALRIPPPDNWHPYIVTQAGTLARRPLAHDDGAGGTQAQKLRSALSPEHLALSPVQIDPAGVALQQRWALGRAPDGSRHLWRVSGQARAQLGGSAGFAHDFVLRPDASG